MKVPRSGINRENLHKAVSSARKILISGTYATGKTTLCNQLADKLRHQDISTTVIGETPRRCPFALNKSQTPLASAWLIGEQIRIEVESMVEEPHIVLCDRGLPDIISHTIVLNVRSDKSKKLSNSLIAIAREWCSTYDLIFSASLDPSLPIIGDGMRIVDKDYQAHLENAIISTYKLFEIQPFQLPRGTSDRVAVVLAEIGKIIGSQ